MKTWDDFKNDIWCSSDGKIWEKKTANTKWQARIRHKTVVFKNKLWLIGGTLSSGIANEIPTKFVSDVWSSEDGINWKEELSAAPWPARHDPKVLVYKNKIWLIGGTDKIGSDGRNDIWSSEDGINWMKITDNAPWKGRWNNGVLVFDNLLWVFGGVGKNDVWFSGNGTQWDQLNDHAPWSTRTTESCITFRNKLWIFSGKTGREDSWAGDIWTLEHKDEAH